MVGRSGADGRRGAEGGGLAMAVLALGAFTSVANAAMLSPLLVPVADDVGVSESAAGQLGTVTALAAMAIALIGAPWMDRLSRRAWLRLQIPVVAAAALLCAFAPGFAWLVAGRALAGLGGGLMLATCMAAAADLFRDPARRNRAVGIIVSATTLAIVAGLPALAQIEAVAGWRWAVAALLLPLALLFAGAGALPVGRGAAQGARAGYLDVLRGPRTVWLLGTMVVYAVVYAGWLTYLGAYLRTDFGAGAGTLSVLFLASGAAQLLANNLTPLLLRRVAARTVYAVTGAVWTLNLIATGVLYTSVWSLFVSIAVTGACACVLYMALYVRVLDAAPETRGTLVSLLAAGSGLGGALGALAGGGALALFGDYPAVYRLLGVVLLASVACFALATAKPAMPRETMTVGGRPAAAGAS